MRPKPVPRISRWTRPYWEAAKEGRFVIQRCSRCARPIFYPRPWCPHCWSTRLDWITASGRATVVTYTVIHQPPWESFASGAPYVLAVARLAEGPQMMANVLGIEPSRVRVGLPVRVVFEDRADGFRIPQFTPDEETR